jgi:hypothetical protein
MIAGVSFWAKRRSWPGGEGKGPAKDCSVRIGWLRFVLQTWHVARGIAGFDTAAGVGAGFEWVRFAGCRRACCAQHRSGWSGCGARRWRDGLVARGVIQVWGLEAGTAAERPAKNGVGCCGAAAVFLLVAGRIFLYQGTGGGIEARRRRRSALRRQVIGATCSPPSQSRFLERNHGSAMLRRRWGKVRAKSEGAFRRSPAAILRCAGRRDSGGGIMRAGGEDS